MKKLVDIICPNCGLKAAYIPNHWNINYKFNPSENGLVNCLNCGFNKTVKFSNELYYWKIPIGDKYLFARSKEDLERLGDYFASNKTSHSDPEMDFPKTFYKNRLELAKRVKLRIKQEDTATNNGR